MFVKGCAPLAPAAHALSGPLRPPLPLAPLRSSPSITVDLF